MLEAVITLPTPYWQVQVMCFRIHPLWMIEVGLALQLHDDGLEAVA